MKLRLLIQIAVVVSIVLLCTGFGVYFLPAVEFGGEPAGFQSLYFGAARCHSHTRNRPYGRPRGGYQ